MGDAAYWDNWADAIGPERLFAVGDDGERRLAQASQLA
jgi:hypothetical protein